MQIIKYKLSRSSLPRLDQVGSSERHLKSIKHIGLRGMYWIDGYRKPKTESIQTERLNGPKKRVHI